ncbi:unnamed protein product, partial [Laminaria digitata]
ANADAAAVAPEVVEHNENLGVIAVEASGRSTEGSGVAATAAATDQVAPAGGSNTSRSQSENQRQSENQSQVSMPAQAQAAPLDSGSGRYRPPWRITGPESGEAERARKGGDDSDIPPGGR